MIEVSAKQYKKAIPKCCKLKTVEEHMSIMLCWGVNVLN